MMSGMSSARSGNCDRERPSAASVPRHVAINVDAAPMPMLFNNERCQSELVSACSYQRSEKPCNGYEKYDPELNESGMIARIGATRKNSTIAVCTRTQRDAMRSVSTLLRCSVMEERPLNRSA